ncbi:hypothetical protein AGABI1DRAFT_87852 [Agaricus bisporus var. burnettii JB137-S8]|uniref:Zn(2)-C6 fungal-type domain-containing protein n=2 Tax=Agaricus bisporus var. burnettii TaxID=192524 RepID=K5WJA6_AGABU|nr:hypothetical protein AGABI2DRAFT_138736 [Agaricus bisporus var. bisporus H97]XP_007333961.1 uncharacterized protein AGABI1DRAFT_87852 [Agaricus bisporus var. burnettii JB137-S8]EKM75381.1 hypothetical protein AGABI1DRAFT_87852 [Agaricus bisporus var. burnettii JB137-S8]EKV43519.1 hypothetical protein AGABI2DRAFT_138736 [Agaricus bisporus var. bisporus H97]KAF7759717.1 transcriptional regulator family: Fungal Specific TF [Agaricus bisporus var. burnettii]
MSSQKSSDQEKTNIQDNFVVDIPRTPKRTPMACQFCRGRKLKCDGVKPSCGNCDRRGYPCVYAPVGAQK